MSRSVLCTLGSLAAICRPPIHLAGHPLAGLASRLAFCGSPCGARRGRLGDAGGLLGGGSRRGTCRLTRRSRACGRCLRAAHRWSLRARRGGFGAGSGGFRPACRRGCSRRGLRGAGRRRLCRAAGRWRTAACRLGGTGLCRACGRCLARRRLRRARGLGGTRGRRRCARSGFRACASLRRSAFRACLRARCCLGRPADGCLGTRWRFRFRRPACRSRAAARGGSYGHGPGASGRASFAATCFVDAHCLLLKIVAG